MVAPIDTTSSANRHTQDSAQPRRRRAAAGPGSPASSGRLSERTLSLSDLSGLSELRLLAVVPRDSSGQVVLALDEPAAARSLSVSRRLLQQLRAAGQIPHVRLAGRVAYPVVALAQWLESEVKGGAR